MQIQAFREDCEFSKNKTFLFFIIIPLDQIHFGVSVTHSVQYYTAEDEGLYMRKVRKGIFVEGGIKELEYIFRESRIHVRSTTPLRHRSRINLSSNRPR